MPLLLRSRQDLMIDVALGLHRGDAGITSLFFFPPFLLLLGGIDCLQLGSNTNS